MAAVRVQRSLRCDARQARIVAVCVSNMVISVVSSCLYYSELYHLSATPAFATQLNAGIQLTVCGVALSALHVSGLAPRERETPIRLSSWLVLALLFALQNTLEIASIDGLGSSSGSLAALLQQAVIPITLLSLAVLLRRRYGLAHYLGAALVAGGIAAAYAPSISTASVSLSWVSVFIASRVPQSLANVRSEQLFGSSRSIDAPEHSHSPSDVTFWDGVRTVVRAGFWTASLGMIFNVPSSLIVAAAKGQDAFSTVFDDYRDGAECLFDGHTANLSASSDRCGSAWTSVVAFALPGAFFAVSEFQVLQYTSAATYFLLVALQLPVEASALSMRAVMGSYASPSRPSLLYGVQLIVAGILCWAAAERRGSQAMETALCSGEEALLPSTSTLHLQTVVEHDHDDSSRSRARSSVQTAPDVAIDAERRHGTH